jgi:hypothetical protein
MPTRDEQPRQHGGFDGRDSSHLSSVNVYTSKASTSADVARSAASKGGDTTVRKKPRVGTRTLPISCGAAHGERSLYQCRRAVYTHYINQHSSKTMCVLTSRVHYRYSKTGKDGHRSHSKCSKCTMCAHGTNEIPPPAEIRRTDGQPPVKTTLASLCVSCTLRSSAFRRFPP